MNFPGITSLTKTWPQFCNREHIKVSDYMGNMPHLIGISQPGCSKT